GIGQLVMHAGMPEQMLPIDKIASSTDPRRLDIESASFGYNFADVGAELAKQWKFPPAFADAIAGFPNPLERNPFDPMAAVLHLAAWRARAEENGLNADELAGTLPTAVAAKLSLSADVLLKQMPPLAELSAGLEALVN
ncbi:MAG: HDOD domain-containing protein, partial [Aquabacterium sp.]